ncbi:growth-regulating factor 6-like isoform X1 [Silene latifolia]|uniref:growth-regulating factor 6-like isoform X1 n=1 Tax=Silene latifolia TaxID=37657 RepID=UPI003D771E4E
MDFGVVSFDGFSLDHQKTTSITCDFSPSKVTKLTNDFSPSKNHLLKHSSFVLSDDQLQEQNMLSFSSPKLENKNLQNSSYEHFQHSSPTYSKNAGYTNNNEGMNGRMCYINGVKWPFTTSQWLELEQQALIYKYIIANQPIPPNLLIPIQRALQSAAFCSFPPVLLTPNSYGWSPFHFGFSNSTDPEPGRCRRTDGKKWRCSRDAVPDQKYCERHINRGRHRSRKPVEAHSGLSLTKPTATDTNSSAHLNHNFSSSAASNTVSVNPNCSFSESHSSVSNPLSTSMVSRNTGGLDFFSTANNLNSRDSAFSIATPFLDDRSNTLWPKPQAEPERTQLSISIPAAPADYRSSTSSPTGEKVTLSPLRLSQGIDPIQMGMGLGVGICQRKQTDSGWETCVGGPLGEVLKPTNNYSVTHAKSSLSGLSLLSAEWEVNQQMCSSPTGIYKRTAQGSLSNSSAGSSSRESSYVAPYL